MQLGVVAAADQMMNLVDSAAEACIHSLAATVLMETLDTGTEE